MSLGLNELNVRNEKLSRTLGAGEFSDNTVWRGLKLAYTQHYCSLDWETHSFTEIGQIRAVLVLPLFRCINQSSFKTAYVYSALTHLRLVLHQRMGSALLQIMVYLSPIQRQAII